ncbi:MAG TPA: glycosyltransferase [Polyangiaceae bacterium]|nr:glycosyltransferase [Polyangiaceae bacterium]
MKVSVHLITYNHEHFIARAISSALEQRTDFDFEIVIGDDCSTDGTPAIVDDFRRRHPDRIRVLPRDENLGMHRNHRRTLEACKGEYVAYLEGDDYWTSPEKLQKQIDFLAANPRCVMCHHAVTVVTEDGSTPPYRTPAKPQSGVATILDLIDGISMATCSIVVKNGLLPPPPDWFYTLKMCDLPLSIMQAEHGDIGYIDEVLGVYRVHDGGVWSAQSRAKSLQGRIQALELLNEHFAYKYDVQVQCALSKCYFGLACEFARDGDRRLARSHLSKSVLARPLDLSIARGRAVLTVKLYAPWLYRPLDAAGKQLFGRSLKL